MQALRSFFKQLALVLAILVALGYLGNLALDNPYAHRILRNAINQQLDDYTRLNLTFEAIHATFVPLGFDIYGLQLQRRQPDQPQERPLLKAAHVQVRLSLWALLLSKPEIFDIEIHEPKFSLPLPPLEDLLIIEKFPQLLEDQGPIVWPPAVQSPLYRLSWINAKVDVRLPAKQANRPDLLRAQFAGFDLQVRWKTAQDIELYIHSRRNNLEVEGRHLLKDFELEGDFAFKQNKFLSRLLRLQSSELESESQLEIEFETTATPPQAGLFNPKAQYLRGVFVKLNNQLAKADIAILGRYLRARDTGGPLNGEAELQLHIPFDDRDVSWRVEGRGQSNDAKLGGFKLLASTLDYNIDADGMQFQNARVIKEGKTLARGNGYIGFSGRVPISFDVIPGSLNLAELLDVLQVPNFQAIQTDLTSEQIELRGQADPFELRIRGRVGYQNLSMPFVRQLPERFLEAPTCLLDTNLVADTESLRIDQASGECWSGTPDGQQMPSPLNMTGRFAFSTRQGLDISLNSDALQLPLLNHFTKIPATGAGQVMVRLHGPYDQILLEGQTRSQNLTIGGFPGQQLQASFRFPLNGDRVYLPSVLVKPTDNGHLQIEDASLEVKRPFRFSARIDAENLPPSFISSGLAQTFQLQRTGLGIKAAQGRLAGPLLEPFRYEGKLQFLIHDLTVAGQNLVSESSGTFVGSQSLWRLQNVYLRLDQLEARLSKEIEHRAARTPRHNLWHQLGLGPEDQVQIAFKTVNQNRLQHRTTEVSTETNHLASLPYVGSFFRTHSFGAEIVLDTQLEGSIDKLQGTFEAALESPFVWGIPISSVYLSGFINGGAIRIPELRHSGNALAGRMNIDLSKPGIPYDWYFFCNQLDVRALIGKFFADDPRNFAYMSAEWTMKGQLQSFWESKGEFTLSRVRAKIFRNLIGAAHSVELNSDDPMRILIGPDRWSFAEKRPLKLQGEYFNLDLTAGNNSLPERLDLSLQGSVKLDILKNFSTLAETARGEVLIDGHLRGSLADPQFSVRFKERKLDPFNLQQWTPVTIGLVDLGPAFSQMSFDIEWTLDQVLVHRFTATKGREGRIEVTGIMNFSDSPTNPSRLSVNLKRVEFNRLVIPVLKTADLVVSGDVVLTGNSLPLNASGNIQVDRFLSIGNFDLRREIVATLSDTRLTASVGRTTTVERKPLLNLDIGVQADTSIVLKNKSLESTLSANLRVRGTDLQPVLLGQILADRGSFNYRRQFKLEQAVISFDEPVSPPNPQLDITGSATISPYQVQVQVTGDLANPRVTLSSDPPNREDGTPISNLDILLLITTGKIPEQANKTAERASVNEIFNSFLFLAEEPLEKLFDLSGQTVIREVYLDSYLSEAQERPVTRLNVPFNLWGLANAVIQVDDESNAKVSFEYPVHDSITLSGSVDRSAKGQDDRQSDLPQDSGFDLKFRFGFD